MPKCEGCNERPPVTRYHQNCAACIRTAPPPPPWAHAKTIWEAVELGYDGPLIIGVDLR